VSIDADSGPILPAVTFPLRGGVAVLTGAASRSSTPTASRPPSPAAPACPPQSTRPTPRAAERFAAICLTTAEQAVARTVVGIKKRKKRNLIGRDARLLDVFQRLMPTGYWGLLRKRAGQRPRSSAEPVVAQEQVHG